MITRSGKSFAVALAIFGLAVTATMAARHGQEQKPSETRLTQGRDGQSPVATFDEPESNNPEKRVHRLEKGRHYDKLNRVFEEEPGVEVHPMSDHWSAGLDTIPIADSDVVVSGDVV